MSLVINNNLMAANTARTLNGHYGQLAQSTQRLSSGLRINSAADDAAGLAIRELQRADIAALQQGTRNANDAISMLQTMEGALQIIDEKLIRLKELAEQAATGTYDSTQRLMIDSEFQAMKKEIDRIANATDFNNIKLLCMDSANKIIDPRKEHDYGWSSINSTNKTMTMIGANPPLVPDNVTYLQDTEVINKDYITEDGIIQFTDMYSNLDLQAYNDSRIKNWKVDSASTNILYNNTEYTISYNKNNDTWTITAVPQGDRLTTANGATITYNPTNPDVLQITNGNEHLYLKTKGPADYSKNYILTEKDISFTFKNTDPDDYKDGILGMKADVDPQSIFSDARIISMAVGYYDATTKTSTATYEIDLDNDYKPDIKTTFTAIGIDRILSRDDIRQIKIHIFEPPRVTKIHFGPENDEPEDYYYIDTIDCTTQGLGIRNTEIKTQDEAQKTLVSLNDAIVKKDNARAYFGAMQNRLENTVTNLTIQAENLQAAESRISDVDVATEMTEFVRNQILTQSAVAMLSQANSLPQMAMQLIGG